jgi:hypothetical protein
MIRLIISFTASVAAFVATFFAFNIAYIQWADWRYPHHNSMAGFAAFYYGLPVGAAFAILGFALAFHRTSHLKEN